MSARDQKIRELRARGLNVAGHIIQMVRDVDHWNRTHPFEKPLTVDDEHGSLARACRSVGLDLATLEAEARA